MAPLERVSLTKFSGLGNLERNAIPQCQLLRLQRLVNDLYEPVERPVPFWLDTMCVPLRRRFRGTAIVDMAKIYKHADKVLVLDSSLSQASTTDSPPIELHMRIMASSWAQRLWTFHETALARRLHYQFTDRALTRRQLTDLLLQSLRSYDRQHPSHCGSGHLDLNLTYGSEARKIGFSRILQSDPIAREAIFWLKELEKSSSMELERDADRLQAISNPLRWRSTSRPEDETICLAGLLDLTIHQRLFLFGIPHSERMKLLILQLDSVPADIIFVDLPRVLDEEFSWIPISFLSGGFNATMTKSRYAQVTSDGLKLSSPGLLVRGQLASIFENNSAFIQYQNNRFSVIPRSTKSLNWGNYHSLESALILRKPLSYPGTTIAALVIVGAKTGDEIICRFICPVWVIGNDVERDLGDTNRAPVAICENSELERWSIQ
jgi:hypothetical protein